MKRLMKLMKKDERGFTLMELMIVLVIIGILAAIAVPNFIGAANTAREKACLANMKNIQNAIELFYAERGAYPTAGTDIADKFSGNTIPTCPQNSQAYTLTFVTNGYEIKCQHHPGNNINTIPAGNGSSN